MSKFLQSQNDFPLTVSLGEKSPTWGLSRWGGNGELRFIPHDDEGFTIRSDKQRLFYKGHRRSHRFTILNDNAFEYDCILLKEPDSNIITLMMDGAERFDFLRQPDFVKDPFLKSSYAVYKKETLIGEGTGKLCHINRPEIIDARGRRCWGDLSIKGNLLFITIPEAWLGEATYPVVVDPTIGTTIIGSHSTGTDPDFDYYDRPTLENQIAVVRYSVTQAGAGQFKAYVYVFYREYSANVEPVLFNEQNARPYLRISRNQQSIQTQLASSKSYGWKSGTFDINETMLSNNSIWFGFYSSHFTTKYDYGGDCYKFWGDDDLFLSDNLPEYVALTQNLSYMNIKFSWYFTYTAVTAQNYVKKLTQGVKLTDNRKKNISFMRILTQTAGIISLINRFRSFLRSITEQVKVTFEKGEAIQFLRQCNDSVDPETCAKRIHKMLRKVEETVLSLANTDKFETICRKCLETIMSLSGISRLPEFFRRVMDTIGANEEKTGKLHFMRKKAESVSSETAVRKSHGFFRKAEELISGIDNQEFHVLFYRSIADTTVMTHTTRHWANYHRELKSSADNLDGIGRTGGYYRRNAETVYSTSTVFRGVIHFVRIITQLFMRDYLLVRFFKAKSELVMKSCITREITLESRIA